MDIGQWNKLSQKEKGELISRDYYYGIDKILQCFVETGCYNEQNPNQDQNWCSCGKPFCYQCVAGVIIRKVKNEMQQKEEHNG